MCVFIWSTIFDFLFVEWLQSLHLRSCLNLRVYRLRRLETVIYVRWKFKISLEYCLLSVLVIGEGIFVSLFLIGRRIVHLYLIFFLLCSLKVKYTKYKCNFIVFFDALDFLFRHSRSNTPIANWLCIDGTQFSNSRHHLLIYLILDFWGGIE